MYDRKYKIYHKQGLSISVEDADQLLAMKDGDCALLYVYALHEGTAFSADKAAKALGKTVREIHRSLDALCAGGLLSEDSGSICTSAKSEQKSSPKENKIKPLKPVEKLPQYNTNEITSRTMDNPEFEFIIQETSQKLGRTLNGTEINTLFGIYDDLRLPAEVIAILVTHCVEDARERSGPGTKLSLKTIEKEAYYWFNNEIITLELADEHIRNEREKRSRLSTIKRTLQIRGRGLSSTERGYIENWINMGFDNEVISIAFDRTVVNTGALAWKYMNAILVNWHDQGLHTKADIESSEGTGHFDNRSNQQKSRQTGYQRSFQKSSNTLKPEKQQTTENITHTIKDTNTEEARLKRLLESIKSGN